MKILLINNFHYRRGGSEAVYFNTADLLRKKGHEVVFFSTVDPLNTSCGQEEYFIRQNKDMPAFHGALNYFYNTDAKHSLARLVEREKPDIAHVHLFWGGISPSIFGVLKKHGIPLVHTVHDYRIVCPAYAFLLPCGEICEKCQGRKFYQCAKNKCAKGSRVQSMLMSAEMYFRNRFYNPVKNIDGFIFVSEFSRKKHQQYMRGITERNSIVLYNTVPDFVAPAVVGDGDEKYFLYFGRLSHEKGLRTLMKAFMQMPDLKLRVVGTGPEEASLKQFVENAGADNIRFWGYKTGGELQAAIANASFVIVPSEWYENNPMAIVESYALGTPVIGSAVGGIPEIIENGKTGFTFSPKDVAGLCTAIRNAIGLPEDEYLCMRSHARRFADKHFEQEVHYARLAKFYEKILNAKDGKN